MLWCDILNCNWIRDSWFNGIISISGHDTTRPTDEVKWNEMKKSMPEFITFFLAALPLTIFSIVWFLCTCIISPSWPIFEYLPKDWALIHGCGDIHIFERIRFPLFCPLFHSSSIIQTCFLFYQILLLTLLIETLVSSFLLAMQYNTILL